jgi:4-aminobutyrate aminotransferase-like enzyme
MDKLKAMQKRFPLIGEVRGLGLMIGIELVSDAQLTPAAAEAEALRALCLQKGVLIGVGGVYGNVVRMQPPLVISNAQIDTALRAIEASLGELQKTAKAAV